MNPANPFCYVNNMIGEIHGTSIWGSKPRKYIEKRRLVLNFHGVTAKFNTKFPTREDLHSLTELIAEGTIKAEIDSIFPLSQADKALEKSEARHGRGRILLNMNSI
ncbi:zinc-binding dehydrogenase [Paenibacillus sp. NPDC056933]|uniref:zinc-binding dehydrogenase n=1 Tax=Paenibacillus sp. NPDC056933 TaxID=3345968 RepID=UPI00362CC21B